MFKMQFILFICFSVAGCASYDLTVTSTFRPTDGGFEYQSIGDVVYPHDSPKAEALRIARLEKYLGDNNLCVNGYNIKSRSAVRKNAAGIYDIFYSGVCA